MSVDIGVFTEINDPHAAMTQFPYDLISPDGLDIGEIGKELRINRVGFLILSQKLHFEPTGQALLIFPVLLLIHKLFFQDFSSALCLTQSETFEYPLHSANHGARKT